ncbi:hypothetical protein VTO42DRAFT_8753 [Malbranchea cinnamomea]
MSSTLQPRLESLRKRYQSALHNFTASSRAFEVIDTLTDPSQSLVSETITTTTTRVGPATLERSTSTLYVFDSSFNPPTLAHLYIAKSALASASPSSSSSPKFPQDGLRSVKLLLLLATQNADKPARPALFEDRLVMMNLFARDLLASLMQNNDTSMSKTDVDLPTIDIGVTSCPYFIDKAAAIATSNAYSPADVQQVHLTGYDTLIRIFEPKYYPPTHTLEPLSPFLEKHNLRVTMRPDDGWGGDAEQRRFVEDLKAGAMEAIKGRREWAERIEMVEGMTVDEAEGGAVSSTKARGKAARGDKDGLRKLVTESVSEYVLDRGFYVNS